MSRREEILKVAEDNVRRGGYNNVSHREIADKVGIKSASVHYYFKSKEDLGAELAHQYTDNFLAALGEPGTLIQQGVDPIDKYISLFRHALIKDNKMCLCGILGAEADCLPDKVKFEVKRFFERNLEWVKQSYVLLNPEKSEDALSMAVNLISALEGALMIGKVLEDTQLFDLAVKHLPQG